jgi:hypothetical protein
LGASEEKDAESSLYSAMVSFRRRNVMGYDDVNTYRENFDGEYVPWEMGRRVEFPGTTDEDYMDVYYAVKDDNNGTYILGDWAYRLTIGPRKGVRVEKC